MKKLFNIFLVGLCAQTAMAQWNNDPAVNLEVSGKPVSDMQTARTNDGKTWIAFYTNNNSGGYDMYVQLLDTAGNKLLGDDGVAVDVHTSGSATYVFNVCTDREGNLILGFQDQRSGSSLSTVGYKVDQTGTSLWNGGDGVVLGDGFSPWPVELSNGEILFAWMNNSGKTTYQKYSSDGTPVWSAPKELAPDSRRAQVAPTTDSGFVMVYQAPVSFINSHLFAQRFDNAGDSTWTSSVQLCDQATSMARYYSILNDNDTTYFGYYASSTSNHFDSWLQRINPDGTTPYGMNGAATSNYATASDPQEQTTNIAMEPGSPYVWSVTSFSQVASPNPDMWGIYVQKFDKVTGAPMFDAAGKVVYPLSEDRYAQQGGLSLKNDGPVFMVAEDVTYHIKGTVLNTNGDFALIPQDIDLSTTDASLADPKGRFAFTPNVANQCIALWTEDRTGVKNAYAQNFRLDMLDTSVTVATVNEVPAEITAPGGTLNMAAAVHPATVSQDVTWSIVAGTGDATISTDGIVTAVADGTVWAKAISTVAPAYSDSMEITISNQSSGVSEIEKKMGFTAYPNPAGDILNVRITASHPALMMRIIDLTGKILITKKVIANSLSTPYTINLKGLAAGAYILEMNGDGVNINKKFTRM